MLAAGVGEEGGTGGVLVEPHAMVVVTRASREVEVRRFT
jgi:hypothetical protein